MPRLPAIQARELIRYLESIGFEETRVRSSHHFFTHPDGRTTVVPVHKGEDLDRALLRKILRDVQRSRDDFLSWMHGDS